jgi:hypothetical protein
VLFLCISLTFKQHPSIARLSPRSVSQLQFYDQPGASKMNIGGWGADNDFIWVSSSLLFRIPFFFAFIFHVADF